MCGRFALYTDGAELARQLQAEVPGGYHPRYNIAPTQTILTLHRVDGERQLVPLRWGLIPGWSKGPDNRFSMINARAESVANKPAYRGPFRHRRCLVPASAFYEWQRRAGRDQPYAIRPADHTLFLFAALWDRWNGPDGEIDSCTLITCAANAVMRPIHERMPVMLDPDAQRAWLDPAADRASLQALLAPAPDESLELYPVSRRVNSPQHEDPGCATPVHTG